MSGGVDNFIEKPVKGLADLSKIIKSNTYSLMSYKDNKRKSENFKSSKFVALDFDNGRSLDQALLDFDEYSCIIGTTRNHQKPKDGVIADRYRVILELSEEITNPEDYKATITKLLEQYPDADPKCKDAARMFYPCEDIQKINHAGTLVHPVRYTKPTLKEVSEVKSLIKGTLSQKTLEFIALGPESKTPGKLSNSRLFTAAVDCLEQGYSLDEAIEFLKPATRQYGGEFTQDDLKTIKSAFNREPRYEPRGVESPFNFKKPKELKSADVAYDWLVDGLLIRGGISLIAGSPKSGKSTITRQLSKAVVNGELFLDRPVKKGKVLYLALEESEALLKEQLTKIGIKQDNDIMFHVGPISSGNIYDSLTEIITNYKADLLVIDTLLLLAQFENINDYNNTYVTMAKYCNIARNTGCHIVCLHHQNKGEDRGVNSILGSSGLMAAVDNFILFNTIRGRSSYRKISSFQRGGRPMVDLELKYLPEIDQYEISANQDGGF